MAIPVPLVAPAFPEPLDDTLPLPLTVLAPLVVVCVVLFVTFTVFILLTVVACVSLVEAILVEHGPVLLIVVLAPVLEGPDPGVLLPDSDDVLVAMPPCDGETASPSVAGE